MATCTSTSQNGRSRHQPTRTWSTRSITCTKPSAQCRTVLPNLQDMNPTWQWFLTLLETYPPTPPQEGQVFALQTTSAEHVMTAPSSAGQSWEKRDENLASPLLLQEREASDARARVCHSSREHSLHRADWPGETLCVKTYCWGRIREERVVTK